MTILSGKKTGIITQARMTSTRLPGKIMKEVQGKTLLEHHIDRLKQTGYEVVIATTENNTDDCVCELAEKIKVPYYRGSEHNVLERFYKTAQKFKFDIIVRVTSDCPLIDPSLIRKGIGKFIELNDDNLYLSNCLERTFARGFDFEIFSFNALQKAYEKAKEEADFEHVTPYIWRNRDGQTKLHHITQSIHNNNLRITVDTEDDFKLIKSLIEDYNAHLSTYVEIEKLLSEHPELVALNAHIEQKKV